MGKRQYWGRYLIYIDGDEHDKLSSLKNIRNSQTGSLIAIVSFATAVIMMNGYEISFLQIIGFILMAGATMVAAPGVTGGAIMAEIGLLDTMLGFNSPSIALMVALYLAQDGFGTACSVAGNCAIINIIDKKYKKMKGKSQAVKVG